MPTPQLVDWGGDVKVVGKHPERRGAWRAGVAQLPSLEELFARFSAGDGGGVGSSDAEIVSLEGGHCLAASGDFGAAPLKFGHHHVVDPRSGQLLKCGRHAVRERTRSPSAVHPAPWPSTPRADQAGPVLTRQAPC